MNLRDRRFNVCDIGRWESSHIDISVLVEFGSTKSFCHGIAVVCVGANWGEDHLIGFDPLQECKVSNFYMAGASGRCLRVGHVDCAVIVLIHFRWVVKGEAELV